MYPMLMCTSQGQAADLGAPGAAECGAEGRAWGARSWCRKEDEHRVSRSRAARAKLAVPGAGHRVSEGRDRAAQSSPGRGSCPHELLCVKAFLADRLRGLLPARRCALPMGPGRLG
ncbi:hypothetical protein NDU88_006979 [Pleurodeles waltl]|uniref:Uncharacterized protein n=1 Tax=Pleurodeles waltl TaxID=8319 RepID=A0AAV7UPD3_PLEWA|nr:hypothetical protein NDU88_006979 [Pleurodeles waltl]